ncbi:MAG: expansin EXLX1 family cellulose-binding protein [Betaproteobacteria bacterium]
MSSAAFAQGNYLGSHTGQGTFYGYSGGGNCSLPFPTALLTAAMNAADYNHSEACGAYVEVTNLNTSQKVVVRIDDQCPGCNAGDVDLAQDAFAAISPLAAGRIPISWRYVTGSSTPAKMYFKEGSSQWWAAIQVRDQRNPVAGVAYRPTGSSAAYTALGRQDYNYFLAPAGMGAGPYDMRITDVFGQVLDVGGVPLTVTSELSTGQQFPVTLPTGTTSSSGSSGSSGASGTTSAAVVSLSPINDWTTGYCTNVNVTNPNSTPLTWSISLNIDGTVSSSWNATLSQSGGTLAAAGMDWNKTLAAGATTQFGFCSNR